MAFGLKVSSVLKHGELQPDIANASGRRKIVWILESLRKYAVDFSVNFTTKANYGLPQLHKTVQQELKAQASLKACNDQEKQKSAVSSRSGKEIMQEDMNGMKPENGISTEKLEPTLSKKGIMQEDMNDVKLKNGISTEKLQPNSSKKLPPKQEGEIKFMNTRSKNIMIRSRL